MSKRKLLLADDSVTIQKVVNLTFADEGIEVLSVGDGDSALELLTSERPDIVLADVHMPGPSGYEICERIRAAADLANTPVLLLVGSFEQFDNDEAARVGANGHITKPFQSIRQLVSDVTELLQNSASAGLPLAEENVDLSGDGEQAASQRDSLDVGMDDELIDEFAPHAEEAEVIDAEQTADAAADDIFAESIDEVELAAESETSSVPDWAMPVSDEVEEEKGDNEAFEIDAADQVNTGQYDFSEFGSTFRSPINTGAREDDPLEAETRDLSPETITDVESNSTFDRSPFSSERDEYADSLHVTESAEIANRRYGQFDAQENEGGAEDISSENSQSIAVVNQADETVDPHAITKEIVIDESDLLELPTLPDADVHLGSVAEAIAAKDDGSQEKVERVVTLSDDLIETIADRVVQKLRQQDGY